MLLWAALLSSPATQADLASDLRRLLHAYRSLHPLHLGPRVLEYGERLPLLLPEALTSELPGSACTRVVVLAAPNVSLVLRFGVAPVESAASQAGLVDVTRCGSERTELATAEVELLSPRGILELLVVPDGRDSLPASHWLPHRNPTPTANPRPLGPRFAPRDLATRLARRSEVARAAGARSITERALLPSELAAQEIRVLLARGCHRVALLGVGTTERDSASLDLDLEVSWPDDAQPPLLDESEATDATHSFCLEEPRSTRLRWVGLSPTSGAVLWTAQFDFPSAIPNNWSSLAQRRLALALHSRELSGFDGPLVAAFLGAMGSTTVHVPVEEGACYLASLGITQGTPDSVALSLSDRTLVRLDVPLDPDRAPLIAFCSAFGEPVGLTANVRGNEIAYILGLWKVEAQAFGGQKGE